MAVTEGERNIDSGELGSTRDDATGSSTQRILVLWSRKKSVAACTACPCVFGSSTNHGTLFLFWWGSIESIRPSRVSVIIRKLRDRSLGNDAACYTAGTNPALLGIGWRQG